MLEYGVGVAKRLGEEEKRTREGNAPSRPGQHLESFAGKRQSNNAKGGWTCQQRRGVGRAR